MTRPAIPDPREWERLKHFDGEINGKPIGRAATSDWYSGWDACLDQIARPLPAEIEKLKKDKDSLVLRYMIADAKAGGARPETISSMVQGYLSQKQGGE